MTQMMSDRHELAVSEQLAARKPIRGAEQVVRFSIGIPSKAPAGLVVRLANINGQPDIINSIGGSVQSVLTLNRHYR